MQSCPICLAPCTDPNATRCTACGTMFDAKTLITRLQLQCEQLVAKSRQQQEMITNFAMGLRAFAHTMTPIAPATPQSTRVSEVATSAASSTSTTSSSQSASTQQKISPPPQKTPSPPREWNEARVGQKWFLMIGILSVILGLGYFLKYSFEQNWIHPITRVALGYACGLGALFAGNQFRKRGLVPFGLALIGGGIAILYCDTVAVYHLYALLSSPLALLVMCVVTLIAGLLAIVHDSPSLATLGLIGGYLSPFIVSDHSGNFIGLLTYNAILGVGVTALALRKQWVRLITLGCLCTWIAYGTMSPSFEIISVATTRAHPLLQLLFIQIFFILFTFSNFGYYFRHQITLQRRHLSIVIFNTLCAFLFSHDLMQHLHLPRAIISLLALLYAALYLTIAANLRKRAPRADEPLAWLVAMSVLLLIIAIPFLVSAYWITIFWALQGCVLLWVGQRIASSRLLTAGAIVLWLATCKLIGDYRDYFLFDWNDWHFMAGWTHLALARWCALGAVLGGLFWTMRTARTNTTLTTYQRSLARAAAIFFGILLFIFLTAETSAGVYDIEPTARFAAISVLWASGSIIMVILGLRANNRSLRKIGIAIFALTIGKIFLVDMSNVSTPYRILSFLGVGLLLIATSYLYYRYRDTFEAPPTKATAAHA